MPRYINNHRFQWQEHDLDQVVEYFVANYQEAFMLKKEEMVSKEWWIDPTRNKLIVKLFLRKK